VEPPSRLNQHPKSFLDKHKALKQLAYKCNELRDGRLSLEEKDRMLLEFVDSGRRRGR
jgi:hypothetical protein